MNANIFEHIALVAADGGRIAIREPLGTSRTYKDLISLTGKIANALVARGVKPGDRVAAQVEKSIFALALYLASVRAGAIYLPLNTAYTLSELEYFIRDAEPVLVVCDPHRSADIAGIAEDIGASVETLGSDESGSLPDATMGQPEAFDTAVRTPDDLAAILYTSGTTGRSKGAMITHGNLVSNALALRSAWRFSSEDVLLHALPIFHVHGLFVAGNVTLLGGASMIFLPRFDVTEIMRTLPDATVMMGVPTFFVRLLQEPALGKDAVRGIRLFVSGSAPLLPETHRRWEQRTGHAILERYGMTETGMNTSNPYCGRRVAGTVGPPLAGVAVRVVEPETKQILGADEIGMIEVKGPNVFKGYWRMPQKTTTEFRDDGFFITGDLGKIDRDGYVHIVGRSKDLIISGGYNVYPKEVEAEINMIPGVVESAVIGVPHPDFGEAVTAIVVTGKSSGLDEMQILASIAARLAKFKLPKRVIFSNDLPRNSMGKILKNDLRDQYHALYCKNSLSGDRLFCKFLLFAIIFSERSGKQ